MSYYNTQNNPQQNPAVQQNSQHNRQVSQQSQSAGQTSFNNWMKPQQNTRQPQQRSTDVTKTSVKPQQQQQQAGWQPRSPVNANGTISTNPIAFNASYQPPPAITSTRTQSSTGGADPLWAQLRTQQNQAPANVPQEYQQVAQAYQQHLGRPGSVPEWQNWVNNPNFATAIAQSPEALAFKQQAQNPMSQAPNPFGNLPQYNPMQVPEFVNYNQMDYGQINTPGLYGVQRPGAYNYDGAMAEGLNPFAQGTQNAFNQAAGMPLGLPVEQMKAMQAETAQEMFQGNAAQAAQRAAASGTVNGGMAEMARQNMMSDRNNQILSSYRDIDVENAMQERQNALDMANTGNTLANSYNSRLNNDANMQYNSAQSNQDADISFQDFLAQQYGDALAGSEFELNRLGAQDDSNRFAADYGQNVWDTLNDNYFNSRSQNLTDFLGTEGMNLDYAKFGEDQGQNKFGNIMDLLGFMEDQRQFNSNFGLDKGKLKLDSRNSALQAALQRRGQDINLLDLFGEG